MSNRRERGGVAGRRDHIRDAFEHLLPRILERRDEFCRARQQSHCNRPFPYARNESPDRRFDRAELTRLRSIVDQDDDRIVGDVNVEHFSFITGLLYEEIVDAEIDLGSVLLHLRRSQEGFGLRLETGSRRQSGLTCRIIASPTSRRSTFPVVALTSRIRPYPTKFASKWAKRRRLYPTSYRTSGPLGRLQSKPTL